MHVKTRDAVVRACLSVVLCGVYLMGAGYTCAAIGQGQEAQPCELLKNSELDWHEQSIAYKECKTEREDQTAARFFGGVFWPIVLPLRAGITLANKTDP